MFNWYGTLKSIRQCEWISYSVSGNVMFRNVSFGSNNKLLLQGHIKSKNECKYIICFVTCSGVLEKVGVIKKYQFGNYPLKQSPA